MSLTLWTKKNASGSWDAGVRFDGTTVEAVYHGFTELGLTEVDALKKLEQRLDGLLFDAQSRITELGGCY